MRQLVFDLEKTGRAFDTRLAGSILLDASKPLLIALQQEVPIGRVPTYKSPTVNRGKRKGQTRSNAGSSARGGALRRSLRIKSVSPEGQETARVIAGASKRREAAGWRAHFVIGGTKKMRANDYQARALQRTESVIVERVEQSTQKVILKTLSKYAK